MAGILLYDEYRFRLLSTIPDISGNLDGYYYQMVELHDTGIISNGIGDYVLPNEKVASSCLTPKGKAASCLKHGATNVNGRFFKVEKDGEIVAYSWVWRCGDVLCFDNIEVTKEFISNSNFEEILFNIYKNVADELIKTTTKIEDRGIKLVIVGRNPIDVKIGVLDKLSKVNDYTQKLFKPNSKEELYLKGAINKKNKSNRAFSLGKKANLNLEDVDPIYKYKRKEVSKFKDFNYKELESKINAIYFDYCIDNNIKYTKLSLNAYVDGFINEDWFVGIREDGKKDIFYAGKDDRALKEIEEYTKQTICFNSGIAIIKPGSEIINEILDSTNYLIDKIALMEYLKSSDVKKYNSDNKFLHGSHNLSTIASILLDGEITSSYYGNRENYGCNNGRYFISLAKKEKSHSLMSSCVYLPSFILNGDICTFSTDNKNIILDYVANMFVNTSYPVRPNLCKNEYQVLNSISLDRADGITVSEYNLDDLAKIIILQDYLDSELPLVSAEKEQIIDKELVKRYIRFKR